MNGVIIVARATADCGKTTAIRSTLFYLKMRNAVVISEQEFNNQGPHKPGDVKAVIEYQGIKIGISSMGDPGTNQTEILDEFIKNGCRIIICACRIWGGTKDPIDALKDRWEIRYIHTASYGFISLDTMWNELMQAIRMIKFACVDN